MTTAEEPARRPRIEGAREGKIYDAAEPAVDILVNGVAAHVPADITDITDHEWTKYWEVTVLSGIRLARHYLPGMLDRDDDGGSC